MKSLYDRRRKFISLLAEEVQFVTGEVVSANLSTGDATGAHLAGALGQGITEYEGA